MHELNSAWGPFSPAVKLIWMKSKGGIWIGFDAVLNDTRLAYDFLLQFFLLGIIVGLVQQVICNNDNDNDNINSNNNNNNNNKCLEAELEKGAFGIMHWPRDYTYYYKILLIFLTYLFFIGIIL